MTSCEILSIGIDLGTSSVRSVLANAKGEVRHQVISNYEDYRVIAGSAWDEEKKINVKPLLRIITSILEAIQKKIPQHRASTIGISGFGPSVVFLSKSGRLMGQALTYAYQGAENYVNTLSDDFQKRTGGFHSGALPFVQLLQVNDHQETKNVHKITTINDYLTWWFTGLSVNQIFSSRPNASYTGLYCIRDEEWDDLMLEEAGLSRSQMPIIVPIGKAMRVKEDLQNQFPMLTNTSVVTGTIDGLDAFWAVGVKPGEKIIVGSAGTTGALRRWRKGPTSTFKSKLVLCCHVSGEDWVELIPFNNVGTSLTWLAKFFKRNFSNYLQDAYTDQINMKLLEDLAQDVFQGDFTISEFPIFFPYIEGEPRGPNGRGSQIMGGFVTKKTLRGEHSAIGYYIGLILGLVNMFRHNLEMLDPTSDYTQIRLTGQIARNSPLFCKLFASAVNRVVSIMEKEHSVAWATAVRSLCFYEESLDFPEVSILRSFIPKNFDCKRELDEAYNKYLEIYASPGKFNMTRIKGG